MNPSRTVSTDEILVEFTGDLHLVVTQLGRLDRGFAKSYPPKDHLWWDTGEALEEFQELIARLNDRSPEGYYFGGHPMEPQCLGYWKQE